MATFNARDKSRTSQGFTASRVKKVTSPPDDQGAWFWRTANLVGSPAYRSLSVNAYRCLDRIQIEHSGERDQRNGDLTVTHDQFRQFGVTADFVRSALDELEFKGLIRVKRGRSGDGTPHANKYRLTFTGDREGSKATNEWLSVTDEDCAKWPAVRGQLSVKSRARWKKSQERRKENRRAGKQESSCAGNPESSTNFKRAS